MYPNKIKELAIKHYNSGLSYRKVAELLDISKSIIHYWINYKYTPKPNKVIDIQRIADCIKLLLISNKFISINEIAIELLKKFKQKFSNSFIYTTITKKLKYTYKKVSKKLYSKNINELIKLKNEFKKKNFNYRDIICIDETYVHSNIFSKYGWAPKGKRLEHFVKSNPTKYSIIVAISCNGIEQYMISNKNINKSIYIKFISELCKIHNNKKFLMDNVSFHKSKEIKEKIEKSSNEIIFIPPYSPELNPIEEVFSNFKRKITRHSNDYVIYNIISAINDIKNSNFENYYEHSFRD